MSRIRTIKPEFYKHPKLGRCARDVRLLFVILITQSDCYGNQRADAALLRMLFPFDDDVTAGVVDGWLDDLVSVGLVRRYWVDGEPHLHLVGFTDNQKIQKPAAYVTGPENADPEPPTDFPRNVENANPFVFGGDFGSGTVMQPDSGGDAVDAAGSAPSPAVMPSGLAVCGNEENANPGSRDQGIKGSKEPPPSRFNQTAFNEWWDLYPRKVGKKAAEAKYRAALKTTTHEALIGALADQARLWAKARTETQFIPHPATWLNQGRWEDEPEASPKLAVTPDDRDWEAMTDDEIAAAIANPWSRT